MKFNTEDINRVKKLYWEEELSAREIARQFRVSMWSVYDLMSRSGIPKRSFSEANYLVNKDKPKFEIKKHLTDDEERLKIAGAMLYWAEGTLKGCTVDFANSNPEMIKIFLKFLREICGAKEERLRVYLYTHSSSNIEELKKYWHSVTNISLTQFTKPYIRKENPNVSNRKMLYGMVHIRYNDKKLLDTIDSWIKDCACSF